MTSDTRDPAHTTGSSLLSVRESVAARELEEGMRGFVGQGKAVLQGNTVHDTPGYQSVAGRTPPVLDKVLGTLPERAPLTILDFIDARVREIDAERNRLSEVRQRVTTAGLDALPVEDLRRLLG